MLMKLTTGLQKFTIMNLNAFMIRMLQRRQNGVTHSGVMLTKDSFIGDGSRQISKLL